jgi:hypothetical protein
MLDKLRSSCLTDKHAAKLQIMPMTEDQAAKLGVNPAWAGFKLTYFHPDGKPVKDFYRYRFWPQAKPSKGWGAVTAASDLRYVQPKNSELHVYLPPLLPTPWKTVMDDKAADGKPPMEVCITEGELKAACACANKIVTLGLGGVFSWMSKKHRQELIPALAAFNWADRPVYLCFDSDIAAKPLVQLAASRLAATLTARGAVAHIVELPNGPEGEKLGMDDYILRYGAASLQALIRATRPLNSSAELHRLNEEVALIWEGGAAGNLVRLKDGLLMTTDKFTKSLYRDRVYINFNLVDPSKAPRPLHAADEWLSWPYRFKIRELTYKPGEDLITDDGYYNTWRPSPLVPAKGDTRLWEELLQRMFPTSPPEDILWFKRWLAFPLRNPGVKMHSCVLIWSLRGGSGKNLLAEIMEPIYGAANYGEITSKQLSSDFNGWEEGKQFIVGDEITLDDKIHASGKLKGMVTGNTTHINRKGINSYVVPNCTNFYFASNNPTAMLLDEGERRTFVHRAPDKCVDADFGTLVSDNVKKSPAGAAAVAWYLMHELDMGDFKFNTRPPDTQAKLDMIAARRSDVEIWAMDVASDPDTYLDPRARTSNGLPPSKFEFQGQTNKPDPFIAFSIYTPRELLGQWDPEGRRRTTLQQLGKALDMAGFHKARYNNARNDDGKRSTYWIIKPDKANPRVLTSTEAAEAYTRERTTEARLAAKQAALAAKEAAEKAAAAKDRKVVAKAAARAKLTDRQPKYKM